MENSKAADKILTEEYSKIKKGQGKPFQVLADKLEVELFDLYKMIRKIDNGFPLQIEEISYIIENIDRIPRWKLVEKFNLKKHHFASIKISTGISFAESSKEDFAINSIKWLIEDELKIKLDDELPFKISWEVLTEHKLSGLQKPIYDQQKQNKELAPLPAIFILVDTAYPNVYKPWQFRGLKKEYWTDKALGKIRLAEALRWLIEEKKKIPIKLIPNLKNHRSFVTSRELQYYHIYSDAFQYQFKSLDEFINFTYPENIDKVLREDAKKLIDKLIKVNRIVDKCEICHLNENLEIHHIIPIAIGGTNDEFNLICLCSNHHTEAHKKNFHQIILSNKIKTNERVDFFKTQFSDNKQLLEN